MLFRSHTHHSAYVELLRTIFVTFTALDTVSYLQCGHGQLGSLFELHLVSGGSLSWSQISLKPLAACTMLKWFRYICHSSVFPLPSSGEGAEATERGRSGHAGQASPLQLGHRWLDTPFSCSPYPLSLHPSSLPHHLLYPPPSPLSPSISPLIS